MAIALLPLDVQTAKTIAAGELGLIAMAANAAAVTDTICEVAGMQARMYETHGAESPWFGYLVQDDQTTDIVGVCSFKGVPVQGVVEIAYFTFPGYEGQGWGGDMATALVDLALGEDAIETVIAYTLAEENPSTKILKRLGFEHTGTLEDPEEGSIWQWALDRDLNEDIAEG